MPILQVGYAVFSVTRLVKTRVHGILKLAFGLEAFVLTLERVLFDVISIFEIIFLWDTSRKTLRDIRISIF